MTNADAKLMHLNCYYLVINKRTAEMFALENRHGFGLVVGNEVAMMTKCLLQQRKSFAISPHKTNLTHDYFTLFSVATIYRVA